MAGARDLAATALRLLAVLVLAATPTVLSTARAEYPALDPERGVMTMAPLLDRATPAVVNISVVSGGPTTSPTPAAQAFLLKAGPLGPAFSNSVSRPPR